MFCKACWEKRIEAEKQQDLDAIERGERQVARAQNAIEDYLWAFTPADKNAPWMHGRPETILRHLTFCPNVDESVRNRADEEKLARGLVKSPSRLRQGARHNLPPMQQPVLYQYLAGDSTPSVASGSLHLSGTLFSPSLPPTLPPSIHLSPYGSQCNAPSPLQSSLNSFGTPGTPRLSPLGSPEVSSFPINAPSTKRQRISRSHHISVSPVAEWSSARQALFNSAVARITASCGFPFIWVENPEWLKFVQEFIPNAISPSRRVLATRLIPSEVAVYRTAAKLECRGQNGTLQYDGWTGLNNHHFLAFRVTLANRTIHTVCVMDTSGERKTAALLLEKLHQVKDLVEQDWGVTVVAVAGDASGESSRARKDLVIALHYRLLAPDCYGHQINLIVVDYFKVPGTAVLLGYGEAATELITWLRSKTFVLAKIRAIQVANHASVVSVRRAVLTRWTSHYSAYDRLLRLRLSLELVVVQDRERTISDIVTGKRVAKEKAQVMLKTIEDGIFWHNLARLKKHLEPLALAANITQLAHTRLDQVLITFGILYIQYNALIAEDESPESRTLLQGILNSIEKRWAKAEQEAFIGTVILHPMHMLKPFNPSCHFTTLAGAIALLKRLYTRFFGVLSPSDDQAFFGEVTEYLYSQDRYKELPHFAKNVSEAAREKGQHPDPIVMWNGIHHPGQPYSLLQKLARRLHSVCANSASCERLFSMFGITLTRLRARLRPRAMADLAELRMYLRDEHIKTGELKERLRKRKMTSHHAEPEPSTAATTGAAQTDNPDENEDEAEVFVAETTTPRSSRSSISQIINRLAPLNGENTETPDDDFVVPEGLIQIRDLFDFQNDAWTEISKAVAMRGLADEMELYDLIDLDAAGEDDNELEEQDGEAGSLDDDFVASSLSFDS